MHFEHDSQLNSGVLGVFAMNTNHTAQHISDKLIEVCREWGIS